SAREASAELRAFAAGHKVSGLVHSATDKAALPRVAFLFSGQASEYVGMGQELYATAPVFHEALDQCAKILTGHLSLPLAGVMFGKAGDSGLLHQSRYAQPALFALEYALCRLWQSWGVQPEALLGHSSGECVAACLAGVFSLKDGLNLCATRG